MRRIRIAPLLAAAACVGALAALPARAGMFDDDEARARIEKLRGEVAEQNKKTDAGLETASHGQIELANQIEALKAEIAKLRGQIEVQTYDIEATQKRQKDFYVDLDTRLRNLESAAAAAKAEAKPAAAPAAPAAPTIDPANETRDYEAALTLFKGVKYREALAAFQDFIKNYGNSPLLPSAHYWAASAHYQLREYAKAAEMFAKVQAGWPKDGKAPDAMLGQANSQQQGGDAKGARKTFASLIEKYPTSSAAQEAKLRLKKK